MNGRATFWASSLMVVATLTAAALMVAEASGNEAGQELNQKTSHEVMPRPATITYGERQLRLALYPCQDCHRLIGGTSAAGSGLARRGKYHYQIEYQHFQHADGQAPAAHRAQGTTGELGEHHRGTCLVCHSADDRNTLRLPTSAGGATVSFNASYRQCLSCHGDKKADYEAGIHGKDIGGYGRAEQIRSQCVDCHNPHSPKIKAMKALPPPVKPRTLIPKKAHH